MIDNVTIVQRMLVGINSFPLLAVIFFVFTGVLMAKGGVASALVRLSEVVVGRLPGGLAQITVLSSMLFGGVSGSAVAEVSSIGATLIPAMEKAGYTKRYATAVVLTSATMGPIIPPSIPMILYAYVVGSVSVAGAVPRRRRAGGADRHRPPDGACYVHGRLHHHEAVPPMSGRDKVVRVIDGLAGMLTLVIILGGITSGIFTATEAGAVGTVYALFLTVVVYREIKLADLPAILWECCLTNAVVLFLIATYLGVLLHHDLRGRAQWLADHLFAVIHKRYSCSWSSTRAAGGRPVRRPDAGADHDGADPVAGRAPVRHGPDPSRLIVVVNLTFGLITPPVGTSLFVGCRIARISMTELIPPMLPLFAIMFVVLLFITYVPEIYWWLPRSFGLVR